MIRKIINTSLALLLFTATIGVSVSKHFCGGMLVEVAINSHTHSCDNSGVPMDSCDSDTQLFALDDKFQLDQQTFVFRASSTELYEIGEVIDTDLVAFELQNREIFDPPLLDQDQDIFIQIQSFLI
jgi:hypothetical protein